MGEEEERQGDRSNASYAAGRGCATTESKLRPHKVGAPVVVYDGGPRSGMFNRSLGGGRGRRGYGGGGGGGGRNVDPWMMMMVAQLIQQLSRAGQQGAACRGPGTPGQG